MDLVQGADGLFALKFPHLEPLKLDIEYTGFEVEIGGRRLRLALVDGALDPEFIRLGRKSKAGEATPDPLGADLSALAHRVSVAGDLGTALHDVSGPLLPLARALRRAEQSGVPISDVVAAVAGDVNRERMAQRRESARRVGVRTAAPLGICFMPAFLLIGIVPTVVATASTIGW